VDPSKPSWFAQHVACRAQSMAVIGVSNEGALATAGSVLGSGRIVLWIASNDQRPMRVQEQVHAVVADHGVPLGFVDGGQAIRWIDFLYARDALGELRSRLETLQAFHVKHLSRALGYYAQAVEGCMGAADGQSAYEWARIRCMLIWVTVHRMNDDLTLGGPCVACEWMGPLGAYVQRETD
jgi:hypothetical protein